MINVLINEVRCDHCVYKDGCISEAQFRRMYDDLDGMLNVEDYTTFMVQVNCDKSNYNNYVER